MCTDHIFAYANSQQVAIVLHIQTVANSLGVVVSKGNGMLCFPFRHKFLLSEIRFILLSWSSPSYANHFVALANVVNRFPDYVLLHATAMHLRFIDVEFGISWSSYPKYPNHVGTPDYDAQAS